MLSFRRLNLTLKLFTINFGSVALFAGILLLIFNQGISMQKEVIGQNMQLYSEVLVKEISEIFHSKYHNVQAMAKNSGLKSNNKEEIQFILDEMMTLYPDTGYIALVSPKGELIAVNSIDASGKPLNSKSIIGDNFSNYDWFKNTKAQKFTQDLEKKIFGSYVGQIKKDEIAKKLYGTDLIGNHFSTIVDDGYGEVQAVLTIFTTTRWIEQALTGLYRSTKSNGHSEIAFLTEDGSLASFVKFEKNGERSNNTPERLGKSYFSDPIGNDLKNDSHVVGKSRSIFESNEEIFYAGSKVEGEKFINSLNWYVIMGVPPEKLFLAANKLQNFFYLFALILLFISAAINYFGGRIASVPIQKVANLLSGNASKVKTVAHRLEQASNELSANTTEQAASIQQISSSLEQTNSMVEQNTTSSELVLSIANDTHQEAQNGKDVMQELKKAIDDITRSTESISELQEIIKSIGDKTKLIDEIVFQTKLLSFNASVEAERAGEHGRGFAVVAQEVGNLASMSGKAATEIANIVKASIEKADWVVKDNQVKVKRGGELSINTSKVLDAIESKTNDVKSQSAQISKASKEQAIGIRQISDAVTQIDQATHTVSENAKEFAHTGKEMGSEADQLEQSVHSLLTIIHGERGDQKAKPSIHVRATPNTTKSFAHNKLADKKENPHKEIKTKEKTHDWESL